MNSFRPTSNIQPQQSINGKDPTNFDTASSVTTCNAWRSPWTLRDRDVEAGTLMMMDAGIRHADHLRQR